MTKNKYHSLIPLLCLFMMAVSISPLLAQGNVLDLRVMAVFRSDDEIRAAINQTGNTSIEIYDSAGNLIKLLEPTFNPSGVRAIDWNSDGSRLAVIYAGSERLNIAIWDVAAATIIAEQQIDFAQFVYWHPVNPDIVMIVLGNTIVIWDLSNSFVLTTYDPDWPAIEYAEWSPSGAQIALLGNSGNVRVLNAQAQSVTFERYENLPITERGNYYFSLGFSPSEDQVALYDLMNTEVEIWNINSGQMELVFNSFDTNSQHYEILRWLNRGLVGIDFRLEQVVLYDLNDGTFEHIVDGARYSGAYASPLEDSILFVPAQVEAGSPLFVEVDLPVEVTPTFTPTATGTLTPTSTETATPTPTPTSTATATPSTNCTASVAASDALGLVNAITAANGNGASPDTICLTNSTYTFLSASNSIALPSITTPITIIGNSAVLERGSGAPQFRLFNVTASGSLTLEDLTIRNGNASGNNGGAILNAGSLTLDGVTLITNTARFGGAIHSSGSLTIMNSTFSTNSVVENGGAIYVNSGSLTLSDTTLESSSARYGSGVYLNNGTVALTNVTARTNSATEQGAGVYQRTGTLTITGGLFENNTARFGNGVYVDAGSATVSGVVMQNNNAVEEGAGIYNRAGTLVVTDSTFANNHARYGAAISNRSAITVTDSIFTGNSAVENGGGLYTTSSATGNRVQNTCFSDNTARFGGAMFSSSSNFDARENWWGAETGPTSAMVNNNVLSSPFLTAGCPNG